MSWVPPSDVPFVPVQRTLRDARLYGVASIFAAGNLILPMALHSIPQGGAIFLPLFFFTLVAAYSEGLYAGLLVALVSPLLNHAMTGMPDTAMLPVVLIKSLFIAVAASLLARHLGRISLAALAGSVLSMQVLGALIQWLLSGDMTQAIQSAQLGVPGMILMTLGGYAVLRWISGLRGKDVSR